MANWYGRRPAYYDYYAPQEYPPRIMPAPPVQRYYAAPPTYFGMDPYQPPPPPRGVPIHYSGPSLDRPTYHITPDIQQGLLRDRNPGYSAFEPGQVYVVREVQPVYRAPSPPALQFGQKKNGKDNPVSIG